MFRYGIMGVMSLFMAGTAIAPKSQSFELSKDDVSIVISGTSTLHDWKMYLKIFDCSANFILEGSHLKGIDKVTFNCRARDLKSDNSLMDKKAYNALKSNSFPEIKFNMTSAMDISPDNNKLKNKMNGTLVIAGKSIPVSIPIDVTLSNNNGTNLINASGKTELKMSDFDIVPPTAMLGTLKTGDKILITFSVKFFQKALQ